MGVNFGDTPTLVLFVELKEPWAHAPSVHTPETSTYSGFQVGVEPA